MCVGMLINELRMCNVMPWTRGFELTGKGVQTSYATFGCLWVGKRVYMSMEVCIDCVCPFMGVCGLEIGYI